MRITDSPGGRIFRGEVQAMAEVKGVLLTAIRAFLLERYGKAAVENALAGIDSKDAALVRRTFLESSFYPYDTMTALATLIRALGPIRRTTGKELGTYIAEYVFKGPYKPLLARDVKPMVEKIGPIKDFFYRDANTVDSAMTGATTCCVTYRYEPGIKPTRGVCRSLGAFWGHALELAGGVTVTATHPTCVAEGADRCEFRYAW